MKLFKVGQEITDSVTEVKGVLTHVIIDMGGNARYIFQPSVLSPETGHPGDKMVLDPERIVGGELQKYDIPMKIMGLKAKEKHTGFAGTIIGLIVHLDGCVHAEIKPKGILLSGRTIDALEIDLRRLEIEGQKPMSKEEKEESVKEKPSPSPLPKYRKYPS